MLQYDDYQKFFTMVEEASNILILNSKPDGDSVGASLALQLLLRKAGKRVASYSPSPIPDYLKFLTEKAPISVVKLNLEPLNDFDLVILVDFCDIQRYMKDDGVKFNPFAKFVCIDHHQPLPGQNINLALTDPSTESTCGIITDLFIEYKASTEKDYFDPEINFLLYTGLVADTDYFGYMNVSRDSFERAAYLMEQDFDPTPILVKFRETLSLRAFRFIQRNIGNVVVNEEKRYAYLKIKNEHLTPDDNLLVVNEAANFLNRALIRIIDTVDFSFILREINEHKCSIALRRHNNGNQVDLSEIAAKFGGGGHKQSAGGLIEMHVDMFEEELLFFLERHL